MSTNLKSRRLSMAKRCYENHEQVQNFVGLVCTKQDCWRDSVFVMIIFSMVMLFRKMNAKYNNKIYLISLFWCCNSRRLMPNIPTKPLFIGFTNKLRIPRCYSKHLYFIRFFVFSTHFHLSFWIIIYYLWKRYFSVNLLIWKLISIKNHVVVFICYLR